MGNANYIKGANKERKFVNDARASGKIAFRSAGSHSPIDVCIIDAYEKNNPTVDTEAAELLLEKLRLELGEYADYLELGGLQNKDDYKRHCDAVIKLYELILKEDKTTAGNALRYMFSQN